MLLEANVGNNVRFNDLLTIQVLKFSFSNDRATGEDHIFFPTYLNISSIQPDFQTEDNSENLGNKTNSQCTF